MSDDDPLDVAALEPRTEREILMIIAGEMRHMRTHQADGVKEMRKQNGRIAALEKARWVFAGAMLIITPLSPLLIYEVRQSVFSFAGGG